MVLDYSKKETEDVISKPVPYWIWIRMKLKKSTVSGMILAISLLSVFVLFSQVVSAEIIPLWVKNTAKWYGDDKISETEFLNAVKFLVDNNIIILESEVTSGVKLHESTATVIIPNGNNAPANTGFYIPLNLWVKKGTVVEWTNEDNVGHTIQSQDKKGNVIPIFNSDVLQTNDKFTYKFDESGEYNYFCTIHPWRVGVITVR